MGTKTCSPIYFTIEATPIPWAPEGNRRDGIGVGGGRGRGWAFRATGDGRRGERRHVVLLARLKRGVPEVAIAFRVGETMRVRLGEGSRGTTSRNVYYTIQILPPRRQGDDLLSRHSARGVCVAGVGASCGVGKRDPAQGLGDGLGITSIVQVVRICFMAAHFASCVRLSSSMIQWIPLHIVRMPSISSYNLLYCESGSVPDSLRSWYCCVCSSSSSLTESNSLSWYWRCSSN